MSQSHPPYVDKSLESSVLIPVKPLAEEHRTAVPLTSSLLPFLAPIERIPVEMLGEIFAQYCLHPYFEQGPMILSSVCQRWRAVATSHGKLWTKINVVICPKRSIPRLPLIETWLERSKTAPLSISIRQQSPRNCPFFAAVPILSLLRPHLARTEIFQLSLQASSPTIFELPTFEDQVPFSPLRKVDVMADNVSLREMTWLSNMLFPAPQLSQLCWKSPHCLDRATWNDLRSLHLCPGSVYMPPEWWDILRQCKELRHLRLDAMANQRTADYATIDFRKLQSLALRCDLPLGLTLDLLTFPNLQTLDLQVPAHFQELSQPWPQPEFRAFVARSCSTLANLFLSDLRIPDRQFSEFLALFPSLSRLEVISMTPLDVRTTIELLTPPTGQESRRCLCPKLKFIKLWKCNLGEDGLLGKMVMGRRTPNPYDERIAQLQHLDVQFFGPIVPLQLKNARLLAECEAQGLEVIVRGPEWSEIRASLRSAKHKV